MGRRQYLTVRKRRCNERETLKQRKEKVLFKKTRLIKCVYGSIQGSIAPSGCVIDMSSDTATMDMERNDTECDGQLSECDDQPEVGNVEPNGEHEIENSKDDSQSDMGDTEHEKALENNECGTQPDMRECKESSEFYCSAICIVA